MTPRKKFQYNGTNTQMNSKTITTCIRPAQIQNQAKSQHKEVKWTQSFNPNEETICD